MRRLKLDIPKMIDKKHGWIADQFIEDEEKGIERDDWPTCIPDDWLVRPEDEEEKPITGAEYLDIAMRREEDGTPWTGNHIIKAFNRGTENGRLIERLK